EADAPVWAAPLLGFEVRLEVAVLQPKPYQALPTQPPVERDVALVLPAEVTAAAVAEVLRRVVGPLLERLEVFDEYRGAGIPTEHGRRRGRRRGSGPGLEGGSREPEPDRRPRAGEQGAATTGRG